MAAEREKGRWRRFGQQLQRNGDAPIAIERSRIAADLNTEWRDCVLGRAPIDTRSDIGSRQPVFNSGATGALSLDPDQPF